MVFIEYEKKITFSLVLLDSTEYMKTVDVLIMRSRFIGKILSLSLRDCFNILEIHFERVIASLFLLSLCLHEIKQESVGVNPLFQLRAGFGVKNPRKSAP